MSEPSDELYRLMVDPRKLQTDAEETRYQDLFYFAIELEAEIERLKAENMKLGCALLVSNGIDPNEQ